jgi:ABC-2 type transport system ATP-binding protein
LDPQGIHQIREIIRKIASMGTTILLASHLLDEVEKVCSHVVIIRKGIKLYSGRVDEMNASHGFFELKANDLVKLQQLLEDHPSIGKITVNEGLLTAILEEPMGADDLNSFLHQRGMVLSYLVKRKESLEEQFLQLTNETAL